MSADRAELRRVGIDATHISTHGRGRHRFESSLLHALPLFDTRFAFHVFVSRARGDVALPALPQVTYVECPAVPTALVEQGVLPWALRRHRLDLLFTCSDRLPLWGARPTVSYVFEVPDHRDHGAGSRGVYGRASAALTRRLFPRSLRRAACVLAASAATRDDLVRLYGVAPDKLRVVYPGRSAGFGPALARDRLAVRARVARGRPYVLLIASGTDVRDDVRTACAALSDVLRSRPGHALVVAGGLTAEACRAASLQVSDEALFVVGRVEDALLQQLYQGCAVYLEPSLYEGFGYQVVEAMSCGVPVVCSSAPSLPEITGGAALLFPVGDARACAAQLARVLDDAALRADLVQRGFVRAQTFSWRATVEQLTQAFAGGV